MDNPENVAAHGTQEEEKQNKNTTQYTKQTQITYIMSLVSYWVLIVVYNVHYVFGELLSIDCCL